MKYPYASKIIQEVAPELGAVVELEPEFEFVGEILFPNGARHLFRNTNLNVNGAGAVEIAKDKGYTSYFLSKHGYAVPAGQTFFSPARLAQLDPRSRRGVDEACAYAEQLGFPVYVKPNDGSQGFQVAKVHDEEELRAMAATIFERTHVLLVQEACEGRDYRVVVLGDDVISAYERRPLTFSGDGQRSAYERLREQRRELADQGRPNSEIDPDDPRIWRRLARLGVHRDTVLAEGRVVQAHDIANLSTGGTAVDITDSLHSSVASLCVEVSKTLGLRLSGVDVLCADATSPLAGYNIVEVNGAPGLDNYASMGPEQLERVKTLYRRILLFLMESHGR